MRNNIQVSPHFKLYEFENREGLVMLDPSILYDLEATRTDLCTLYKCDVAIIISRYGAVRTEADNNALAERLGWIDEPCGKVSRISRHLSRYGGIAADISAVKKGDDRKIIPERVLGDICRRHFDFVKDDYSDGHVHVDNRDR